MLDLFECRPLCPPALPGTRNAWPCAVAEKCSCRSLRSTDRASVISEGTVSWKWWLVELRHSSVKRDTRPGKHTKSYWTWPFIVDLPMNSMVIFNSYISLPEGKQGERKPKMRWHNCLGGRWSSRMFLGCFRPGWWGIGHPLLTSMSQCWRETCVNSWRFYLGCLQKSTAQFYIMNHGSQRNQPWDRIDQMFSSANPVDGSLDIQYNNICFAKESPSSAGTKLCTITRVTWLQSLSLPAPGL